MAGFSKPQGLLPMLFALLVLVQAAVALHSAHSSPEAMKRHFEETKRELQERQTQTAWTNGRTLQIDGINRNSPAARLEIRDLARNSDAWNLYLLGMERFMAKPRSDRVSYYQIAGVHGRPFIGYNTVTPRNQAGFCPHSMSIFGTWHRPYLALFEQAWWLSVQEVINTFPENQRNNLRNVARDMRMPYYDWAKFPGTGQDTVPRQIRDQTVTVRKPQGQVTIPNPLYKFNWGSSLPSEIGGGPWNNWHETLRRPVANPTRSNNNEMNARFGSQRIALRDRIYNIFAASPNPSFGDVSTSSIGGRTANGARDSFESIHDAVHVATGGETGGHMYYLDLAAYDPMFWLHHTNIDRLLAMYQTHSTTGVASGRVNRNMAQWNTNTLVDGNTDLIPFTRDGNGRYWKSNDVMDTRQFGYFYPETRSTNLATRRNDVVRTVIDLYSWMAPTRKRSMTLEPEPESEYETPEPEYESSDVKGGENQFQGRPYKQGDENYILSVIANKYALDGSYSIHCFIGNGGNKTSNATAPYPVSNSTASPAYSSAPPPYPTDAYNSSPYPPSTDGDYNPAEDFTQHPDYVGNYGVLGMGKADASNPVMVHGSLPLTTALQGKEAAGYLKSLKSEDVVPYLKDNLYCKVIGPGNTEIPADEVPDLHLGVEACKVTPPKNTYELPSLHEYKPLPEVTKDKPAGKPYKHVLKPIEVMTPGKDVPSPSGTVDYPYPSESAKPEECKVQQVFKYVDMEGNFLYEEKM